MLTTKHARFSLFFPLTALPVTTHLSHRVHLLSLSLPPGSRGNEANAHRITELSIYRIALVQGKEAKRSSAQNVWSENKRKKEKQAARRCKGGEREGALNPRSQRQSNGHGSGATTGRRGSSGSEMHGCRRANKTRRGRGRAAARTDARGRRYPGDPPRPRAGGVAAPRALGGTGAEEGRARHAVAVLEAGGVAAAARGGGSGGAGGDEEQHAGGVGAAAGRHPVGDPGRHPGRRRGAPDPATGPEGANRRRGGCRCGSGKYSLLAPTPFPSSRST
jgi:hypothetical protein